MPKSGSPRNIESIYCSWFIEPTSSTKSIVYGSWGCCGRFLWLEIYQTSFRGKWATRQSQDLHFKKRQHTTTSGGPHHLDWPFQAPIDWRYPPYIRPIFRPKCKGNIPRSYGLFFLPMFLIVYPSPVLSAPCFSGPPASITPATVTMAVWLDPTSAQNQNYHHNLWPSDIPSRNKIIGKKVV